jgi:Holliday junction resolvase RusA-like endonuclease
VIACARTDMETQGVSFLVGPLGCDMFFYLPRPKSIPARRKDGTIPRPITRPDKGKLERATEDALTIAGVWNDDSQVVEGFSAKWYATDDTPPGAFIQVWTL